MHDRDPDAGATKAMPANSPASPHLTRRQALLGIGAGLAGTALAVTPAARALAVPRVAAATTSTLTLTPEQEEGPFYVVFDDIRSDITGGQTGVPLTLTMKVVDVDDNPVVGAALDIWQANPAGVYSDEASEDTTGQTYLRGTQITSSAGTATFTTIVPGWYSGRCMHIHVKVHTGETVSGTTYTTGTIVHTGQMFFPAAVETAVHTDYASVDTQTFTATVDDRVYTTQGGDESVMTVTGSVTSGYVAGITLVVGATGSSSSTAPQGGYRLVASDGGIFDYGTAAFEGSEGGRVLDKPIVGMSPTSSGAGYWLVASDGGVFAFGDARFHGSAGDLTLSKPVVGMAPTATGGGYWLVASDGGLFSYGDAAFLGSASATGKTFVGMAAVPAGGGYWLAASDGTVRAYGTAVDLGPTAALDLTRPVVGMATTPSGNGYWLVASDGGVFSYGDAAFHGSAGNLTLTKPVVGIAATLTGDGYWLVASDGGVFSYGDATFYGSAGDLKLTKPVVGISTVAATTV